MGIKAKCSKCGKIFTMGLHGVTQDGRDLCDSCAGVQRDRRGFAWYPDVQEKELESVATGKIMTVKREKVKWRGGK